MQMRLTCRLRTRLPTWRRSETRNYNSRERSLNHMNPETSILPVTAAKTPASAPLISVPATYRDPQTPAYQGNPLIEALPSILTRAEVIQALTVCPNYDSAHPTCPTKLRLHLIYTATNQFFQPLPEHLD